MHKPFPDTATFTGFNAPRRIEADVYDLQIEGQLPLQLNGTFYRCGPDPRFAPIAADDINLNGDGMVVMFRLAEGHADFKSRYVRTERYELESAARRALFGAYRNPYTNDPSVRGRDGTTANTNVVFHAGRLFALKEDGLPHQLDPHTLETLGRHDYDGKLRSVTATAHPKIDPASGEMVSFGYEACGLATRDMSLQMIDASGRLAREEFFLAPYVSFQHDFAVTQKHVVFALMPTTTDDARLRAGGPHWAFDSSLPTVVGIMPRDGNVSELRWFNAPAQGVGHILNAFDEGGNTYVDLFISERNQFPFVPNLDGTPFERARAAPRLTRWSFDLSRPEERFEARTMCTDFMEMPRIDDRYHMNPHRYGFFTAIDPEKPVNIAGTIGLGWNTVARIDVHTGKLDRWYVGEKTTCQEPQFVPRSPRAAEGDGYLLTVLTRFGGECTTELAVLDAQHLADGPIARILMPFRLRGAVHGNWVPRDALSGLGETHDPRGGMRSAT